MCGANAIIYKRDHKPISIIVDDPQRPLDAKWNGAAVKSGQSTTSTNTSAKFLFNPVESAASNGEEKTNKQRIQLYNGKNISNLHRIYLQPLHLMWARQVPSLSNPIGQH